MNKRLLLISGLVVITVISSGCLANQNPDTPKEKENISDAVNSKTDTRNTDEFNNTKNDRSEEKTPEFSSEGFGDDIVIDEGALNSNENLVLSLRNRAGGYTLQIHNVTISNPENRKLTYNDTAITLPGDPTETKTLIMSDVNASDRDSNKDQKPVNTFDLMFTYTIESFPDANLTSNGTITGAYRIEE
jgi:hypothetical protein